MRFAIMLWGLFVFATGGAWAAEWPGFGGPTGDFKSPERGIRTDWPDQGLPVVWHTCQTTGEGYCAPAVADGRLYLFDRVDNTQRLRCLDAGSGREHWSFTYRTTFRDMYGYDGGPRACPVVDGDRVYILGPEGILHCLSTADGSVIWKLDTMSKFKVVPNFFGVGAAPVIEGNLLIMQVGGSPPDSPPIHSGRTQGNGSGVVALDKVTGDVIYSITDELASYSVPVLATINDRRWCFVLARGGLIGFNPADGSVDFHFPWRARIIESANASNPVVAGDRVFISECYGPGGALLRVEPGEYEVLWKDPGNIRQNAMACHWMTPIHIEGYLYGSSGRHDGNAELRCIELATGKVRWSVPRLARCSLLSVDGHLLVLSEYGQLILIRATPEKFDVVAAYPGDDDREPVVEYPAWAAPVLSNGLLYLRGKEKVVCLKLIEEIAK
jgi:outer membrane protein assembly factor BamB